MSSPELGTCQWRKSSFSGGSGNGNCVEIGRDPDSVAVRDSKNAGGPVLDFAENAWHSFLLTTLAH